MEKVYTKSLDDEIDWKIIDQLHSATLNFSNTSLEIKKLFFVLLGVSVPLLIKLSGDKLNLALFISLYLLTLTFWFLDSFTYFYQEKLREKMNTLFNQIKSRNKEPLIVPPNIIQEFTIESTRHAERRAFRSAFNPSNRLYIILLALNIIAHLLFIMNIIK